MRKNLVLKSITAEVKEIYADEEIKEIMLKNGDTLKTRTIILATGAVHQTLGIEGEEKLKGMGVSYCATCDGAFFRNKVTAVCWWWKCCIGRCDILKPYV